MKKGNLSSRLTALKTGKKSSAGKPAVKTAGMPSGTGKGIIHGWERIAPFVLRKETIFKDQEPPVAGQELKKVYSAVPEKALLFFDLETTGLSGGAGNIAFLAGVGKYYRDGFHLVQIFLEDYPGERDFLLELKKYLSSGEIWVSYNGKAFDSNLLKTRFLMNGEEPVTGLNLDLLFPSRRLWKTILPDCSLGTIEEYILRKERKLDIPGRLIPDIYFGYLKTGDERDLQRVFAHHLEDILSLLQLYNLLGNIFSESFTRHRIPLDKSGLGYLLLSSGFLQGAVILEEGLKEGNRKCGILLGEYYKRNKNIDKAFGIWKKLWDENPDPVSGIELAKVLEHRQKDFLSALEIVENLIEGKGEYSRLTGEALLHRKKRLERKLKDARRV